MRRVLVTYNVKPGKAKDLVLELEKSEAAANVRKEDGCLEYNYYLPVNDDDKALLVELWENEESHKAHLAGPNRAPLGEIKSKYVNDQKIEVIDN